MVIGKSMRGQITPIRTSEPSVVPAGIAKQNTKLTVAMAYLIGSMSMRPITNAAKNANVDILGRSILTIRTRLKKKIILIRSIKLPKLVPCVAIRRKPLKVMI